MVKLRKDSKAIPFPRIPTRSEIERFWMKLQEDVLECREIMPNKSEFNRKFAILTYDSFEEAYENYRRFRDSVCKGEEYELPEKYTKIQVLGKFLEDEVVIVTGRLYANTKNCAVEPILDEVLKVRGTRPSLETIKISLVKGWRQHKGIILKNEEELSHYTLEGVPKKCLEKIIGDFLPEYA